MLVKDTRTLGFRFQYLRLQFLQIVLAFAKNTNISESAEFKPIVKSLITEAPVMLLKVSQFAHCIETIYCNNYSRSDFPAKMTHPCASFLGSIMMMTRTF